LGGIVAYLVALPVGSLVIGFLLHLLASVFGRLPAHAAGAVALVSALVGSRMISVKPPESGWRIPQSWARFGHATYSGLFGGILGLGVLTAVPSIGFYTLLVWGAAADSWQTVWPVFGAFGVARALPLFSLVMGAERRRAVYPDREDQKLDRWSKLAAATFPAEIVLLAAIGVLLLMHGAL
jgi:hypothetical protein